MPLVLVPENAEKPAVRLQQGATELGRSKTTRITDPRVSRKHAVVRVEGDSKRRWRAGCSAVMVCIIGVLWLVWGAGLNVFVLPVSTNQCMR